jgi:hypothetical protein
MTELDDMQLEHDRGADVIQLRDAFQYDRNRRQSELEENAPVRREDSLGRDCRHVRSTIDFGNRRIRCRDCNAELDPYQVLDDLARARESQIRTAQRYRAEIEHTRARLAKLEQQERNAKSRLKRARDRLRAHGIDPYKQEREELHSPP